VCYQHFAPSTRARDDCQTIWEVIEEPTIDRTRFPAVVSRQLSLVVTTQFVSNRLIPIRESFIVH
jgi:hypothetical protein